MPRQRDIPRGQRTLSLQGPRGSGAGRVSQASGSGGVDRSNVSVGRFGGVGQASPVGTRGFSVQATGQFGLRQLAGAFTQLGALGEQIMDDQFRQRAKVVEREQSLAGAEYGLGVDIDQLQLPAGDSVGDEAFRRSAMLASRAKVDVATYDDVEELAKAHPGKPEEFKAALTERTKAFVAKLPVEMRPDAAMSYARLGQQKYFKLDDERRDFQRDENRASIIEATEIHQVAATRAARSGDYNNAQEELGKLAQLMTAAGPVELGGSGALSLVEIEKASIASNDAIRESFLVGWVDRSDDPQAVIDGLKSGQTGNATVDDILAQTDPGKLDPFIGQMERDVKAAASAARVEARQAASLARQEAKQAAAINRAELKARKTEATALVGDSIYALQRGKQPPELAQVAKIASEFPELAAKLENGFRQYDGAQNFAKYPEAQRIDMLNQLAADPIASREDVEFTEALKTRHNSIVNNPDKVSAAVDAGIIPPIPLDITDPASVQAYLDNDDEIKAVWGIDTSVFRKDQIDGLATAVENMTPEEKLATLSRLGRQMESKFDRILPQIADKEPATAMAAKVGQKQPQLGADILRGQQLLKDGTVSKANPQDYAKASDDKIGTALKNSPSASVAVREAAQALEAARRFDGGKTDQDSYDEDTYAAAIDEVTGGVLEYNDEPIIAPERGVDADTFNEILGLVDDEDLAVLDDAGKGQLPVMPTGGPLTAEAFKKYAKLESVGEGRYLVKIANGYAFDPLTNQPYVFDWQGNAAGARRRAAEGQRARREDLLGVPGNDALGGDAGLDVLAPGIGGTATLPINPSVAVLLQRLLGRIAPAANDPQVTEEAAAALGAQAEPAPPPADSTEPQSVIAGDNGRAGSLEAIAENARTLKTFFGGGEYPKGGRQSDMVVDMRPQTRAAEKQIKKTKNDVMRIAKKYGVDKDTVAVSFSESFFAESPPQTFAEEQAALRSYLELIEEDDKKGVNFWTGEPGTLQEFRKRLGKE